MCILFIYRNPNPSSGGYKLILTANRDEYYARPAKLAHYWEGYPDCLGGTDMEPGRENGTWLGCNTKNGRVGVILNLHGGPKSTDRKGRGFLIRDYLTSSKSTIDHAFDLHKYNQETQAYNPFNLVMIELRDSEVYYLSSLEDYAGPVRMTDKILGFGNSIIETPYQKVLAGKEQFQKITEHASIDQQEELVENIIYFMKQRKSHLPDPVLQKRFPDACEKLSSIFVEHEKEKYGTRTHTVILIDTFNTITFVEESMEPDGTWKRQTFTNKLD